MNECTGHPPSIIFTFRSKYSLIFDGDVQSGEKVPLLWTQSRLKIDETVLYIITNRLTLANQGWPFY
jgi:hypothetical protein